MINPELHVTLVLEGRKRYRGLSDDAFARRAGGLARDYDSTNVFGILHAQSLAKNMKAWPEVQDYIRQVVLHDGLSRETQRRAELWLQMYRHSPKVRLDDRFSDDWVMKDYHQI